MKCLLVRCSSIEREHQKEVKFGTPSLQTPMVWNTPNLRSSRGHVETTEEEGERRLQNKFEKKPWNVWENVVKDVGRWRGGSEEEKEEE